MSKLLNNLLFLLNEYGIFIESLSNEETKLYLDICEICERPAFIIMPEKCYKVGSGFQYKEVVIIGNGPSAISLSYMLSGNIPFVNGITKDEYLNNRLADCPENVSLVYRDLEYLADGLEGRSSNPVSVLFDALSRPDADLGIESPSIINWKSNSEAVVDHVVLGKGEPGGVWKMLQGDFLTVSLGSWMELPNLKLSECSKNDGDRVSVSSVAEYYENYVNKMNLTANFRSNVVVTSVKKSQASDYCIKKNPIDDDEIVDDVIEEIEEVTEEEECNTNAMFLHQCLDSESSSSIDDEMEILSSSLDSLSNFHRHRLRYDSYFDESSARDEESDLIMNNICNSWDPICNPNLFGQSSRCSGVSFHERSRSKCCFSDDKCTTLYEVTGYELSGSNNRRPFKYLTKNIVLATGSTDKPNQLSLKTKDYDFVFHSLMELEKRISSEKDEDLELSTICIVGAGLSAADAILTALERNIDIIHVFRRDAKDLALIFNRLPQALYPEYHRVHRLMKGEEFHRKYQSYPETSLSSIDEGGKISLSSCPDEPLVVSFVALLIGSSPNLNFFDGYLDLGVIPNSPISRNNPVAIDAYSHESLSFPGVYAMGPLVGDNFVRFLLGGALAISNSLLKKKPK